MKYFSILSILNIVLMICLIRIWRNEGEDDNNKVFKFCKIVSRILWIIGLIFCVKGLFYFLKFDEMNKDLETATLLLGFTNLFWQIRMGVKNGD